MSIKECTRHEGCRNLFIVQNLCVPDLTFNTLGATSSSMIEIIAAYNPEFLPEVNAKMMGYIKLKLIRLALIRVVKVTCCSCNLAKED